MRAHYRTGIKIVLLKEDKETGEKEGKLECVIEQFNRPKLIIHILDKLNEKMKCVEEEPGFHIIGTPKYGGPGKRKKYDIYLTKERFTQLTNPQEDPVVYGGYFASRSLYDRVDIKYFGL